MQTQLATQTTDLTDAPDALATTDDVTALPEGVDISHHQGNVNWHQLKAAGISFAFIKATEGTSFIDPAYNRNKEQAEAAGIMVGAYHYFRPHLPGIRQAQHFLRVVGPIHGMLQPVLDFEETDGVSTSLVLSRAVDFCAHIKAHTGADPIIYTYVSFWRDKLRNPALFGTAYPLWLAHYTSKPQPTMVGTWPRWTFWQYTSTGRLPGVVGRVDRNRFNGSLLRLSMFIVP